MPFDPHPIEQPATLNTLAADVIDAAISVIDTPRKWCKGVEESLGRHCMIGALHVVAGFDPGCRLDMTPGQATAPWQRAVAALQRDTHVTMGRRMIQGIVDFNDHWTTRHADVMRLMRTTAARLREAP